jgi:hypothetical protein
MENEKIKAIEKENRTLAKKRNWQKYLLYAIGGIMLMALLIRVLAQSPPTFTTAFINSTDVTTNYSTVNLTVWHSQITDLDSDSIINFTGTWYEDNQSFMVLSMPFETNSTNGETRDYSGWIRNGTLGTSTLGDNAEPIWNDTNCKIGGCYAFDGSNDYIKIENTPELYSANITVELWVKPYVYFPAGETYVDIIRLEGNNGFAMEYYGTDLAFSFKNSGGGYIEIALSQTATPLNEWTHLVMTYNSSQGNEQSVYTNGIFNRSLTRSGRNNVPDINDLFIGCYGGTSSCDLSRAFKGEIDGVRVYNRSLSPNQVYQNYQDGINNHSLKTLVSNELKESSTYKATLYATDNITDSNPVNTSELLIKVPAVNNPPTFTNSYPQINSSDGTNTTIKPLYAIWIGSDPEANPLTYSITWFTNNKTNFTLTNLPYTGNTLKVDVLTYPNLTGNVNNNWSAQIALSDGTNTAYKNTSALKILNDYSLYIQKPTTTVPNITTVGSNITIEINFSKNGINQTTGVNLTNVTINNVFANILNLTVLNNTVTTFTQNNYTIYYNFSSTSDFVRTVFNRTNQNLGVPPLTTEALDGTNSTTCATQNLATSDNVYCTVTENGGNANTQPWMRFNFTIPDVNSNITSITITLEVDNSGSGSEVTNYVQYNRTSATAGVWSLFGAGTTLELSRSMIYTNQYNIQQVLSNITNQTILLAEGTLNDDGEQVIVDFVQVVVNVTNYTVTTTNNYVQQKQFWYDGGWKANITVPSGLTNGNAYDLFVNATYEVDNVVSKQTQTNAICIGSCPVSENTAPTFTNGYPQLNSTNGLNRTNSNLHATFIATDTENNTLKYNVTFFVNNKTNFTTPLDVYNYPINTMNVTIVNNSNLSVGDTWIAMVNLFDGINITRANSSELLILSTPADTCTPPDSGTWNVLCSDACIWNTNQNIPNNINMQGSGILNLYSKFIFKGSNQNVIISPSCQLNINPPNGGFG